MRGRGETGQSTVELVAMLPVVVLVALAMGQLLAAGAAREAAAGAAQAAAMAALQGGDPRSAADAAVPPWARERMRLQISGSRVTATLSPRAVLPGLADLLVVRAQADWGGRR